jgi:hypothetical protein
MPSPSTTSADQLCPFCWRYGARFQRADGMIFLACADCRLLGEAGAVLNRLCAAGEFAIIGLPGDKEVARDDVAPTRPADP